jgi:hypothetical protein
MEQEQTAKVESLTKAHAIESQAFNQAADNLKFQVGEWRQQCRVALSCAVPWRAVLCCVVLCRACVSTVNPIIRLISQPLEDARPSEVQ